MFYNIYPFLSILVQAKKKKKSKRALLSLVLIETFLSQHISKSRP